MLDKLFGFSLWSSSHLPPTGRFIILFHDKVLIGNIGTPWVRRLEKSSPDKVWMRIYPHIDMWEFGLGFEFHWHLNPELNIQFLFFHLHIQIYPMYWKENQ